MKGVLKKVGIAIVVLVILAAVFGGGGEDKKKNDTSGTQATAASSEASESTRGEAESAEPEEEAPADEEPAEEEVDYQHLAIGEGVTFKDGTTVTVNEVQTGLEDYSGDPVTRVNVTYVNEGDDKLSFGTYDWNAEDANGVQRGIAIMIDGKDEIDFSGSLAPGGTITGNLYLEGEAVRVLYQNNMFISDSEVGWDVQ